MLPPLLRTAMGRFIMTISKLAKGSTGNRLGFFFYTADSDGSGSIDKVRS